MPNEVNKSLLDRLQALRGASATPERVAPSVNVDLIERKKTPTREDNLASRLKSLRDASSPLSQCSTRSTPKSLPTQAPETNEKQTLNEKDADLDASLQTDDQDLQDLLSDILPEDRETFTTEPDDEEVRALLEQLADSMPQDETSGSRQHSQKTTRNDGERHGANDSDESDEEATNEEADDIIARFKDEIALEKTRSNDSTPPPEQSSGDEDNNDLLGTLPDLPTVPTDLTAVPSSSRPKTLDDLTARLSLLRATSMDLPDVPSNKPAIGPKRLQSTTKFTDDDMDTWCTVCLEDASLTCTGCIDDKTGYGEPYCARCWREMHVGESAGYDERSHKAIQFNRKQGKEKKVAVGAQ